MKAYIIRHNGCELACSIFGKSVETSALFSWLGDAVLALLQWKVFRSVLFDLLKINRFSLIIFSMGAKYVFLN